MAGKLSGTAVNEDCFIVSDYICLGLFFILSKEEML